MARGIGYNGIVPESSDLSNRVNDNWQDEFYDVGNVIKESISKISILSRDREMLYRIEKDYKAFANGIQSALNEGTYFRQGQKMIDPVTGMSAMNYYVQTSELKNALEAIRSVQGKMYGAHYETRPPEKMDYITGTRTFEGRQAQAKAQLEISRRGGKLLATPTVENPDLYTYMLPFSDKWASGTALDEYLNLMFTGSDALSKFEHEKRASEAEVDLNYAKAKKAEMMKKLSASQTKEAGSVWDEFEKEQQKEEYKALQENSARAKQMAMIDALTASQAKEAGKVWDDFEAEENAKNVRERQREAELRKEEEKKKREEERQKASETMSSKTKRTFLLGQIASMFIILLDLTRRILTNGLAMASQAKQTEMEARNIGSSYGSMLQYNYADRAYGLKEGTTASALFGIQKMFGNPANLDTNALEKLAPIMGSDLEAMAQSGLGRSNPEALLASIMNAFFKAQQEGRNQFGQFVGQEEARRSLYTLLSEISPEIATLFSRMVEANTYGINKGQIGNWQDYLDRNRRITGNLSDTDLKSFTALGEVVDELKAKFSNLVTLFSQSFLLNLSGFIDRINNLGWGKSPEEDIESKESIQKKLKARRDTIGASQVSRESLLLSTLSEYGASGNLAQIISDVEKPDSFVNSSEYTAEEKERIKKNKKALSMMYAYSPMSKDMLIQYVLFNKAMEDIETELHKDKPSYMEYALSDEGIIAGQRDYTGALSKAMWTGDLWFSGATVTDFWEMAVKEKSYYDNLNTLERLMSVHDPVKSAQLYSAYRTYMDKFATNPETKDYEDFNLAMLQLYKKYEKDNKGSLSKQDLFEFSADEENQLLAYIMLMTGSVKTGKKNKTGSTALDLYRTSSVLEGLYEADRSTIANLESDFLVSQGNNALANLGNTGFTITPVGGGIFTIRFVADVNGKEVEKEYKGVPLKGRYEEGIEYSPEGLQERYNSGNNQNSY